MKKKIIYSGIIILTVIFYFVLRGTPDSKVPNPTLIKAVHPHGQGHGRPIPYHEVFLGWRNWFSYNLIIYNDLNNVITPDDWVKLDEEKIKKETGADIVVFNGPRFWVLDEIIGKSISPKGKIQGHEMLIPAYFKLSIKELKNRKPYKPFQMNRDTKYVYYANDYLYKLIAPDGTEYAMQAASRELDPNLKLEDLKDLGSKLQLKDGWQYKAEIITEKFINESGGQTIIVQDEMRNTYQIIR